MDLLSSFDLSLNTLLATFILPFAYFSYHTKYWWRPDILKRADTVIAMIAVFLAIVVLLKMAQGRGAGWDFVRLGLLHLAVLVLALLTVSKHKLRGKGPVAVPANAGESKDPDGGYQPMPLNQGIEAISWDDLIIDQTLKEELISTIELLGEPQTAHRYGIEVPKGILLSGPPGTGKTTIAKAMANTAKLTFFALKMDEVVSKWVGESEKNLTRLFNAANRHAPAVIFIDEVDSIGRVRSGGQTWAENLLNHLLQLVDGVIRTEGLYVIAATNRADLVDDALKRAGRLNKVIEVPLPDFESRVKLFQLYLAKLQLGQAVNLQLLAEVTQGKSGADIKAICNQAGLNAFKRESGGGGKREYVVTIDDIERALAELLSPQSKPE